MLTRARADGAGYRLSGTKMWITNGNIADIAVIWAKTDDDVVRGFVVPEINLGQLLMLVRAQFLVDAIGINEVRGKMFRVDTLIEKTLEILER